MFESFFSQGKSNSSKTRSNLLSTNLLPTDVNYTLTQLPSGISLPSRTRDADFAVALSASVTLRLSLSGYRSCRPTKDKNHRKKHALVILEFSRDHEGTAERKKDEKERDAMNELSGNPKLLRRSKFPRWISSYEKRALRNATSCGRWLLARPICGTSLISATNSATRSGLRDDIIAILSISTLRRSEETRIFESISGNMFLFFSALYIFMRIVYLFINSN